MTSSVLELVETVPGDALFPGFCAVWAASGRHARPHEPARPASDHEALGRLLLAQGGARDGTHRVAVVDGEVVGALRVVLPTQENTTVADVHVAVHPEHRRRGTGTRLLQEGLLLARAAGRTTVLSEVDEVTPDAPGSAFARHHGATADLVETRRDLLLPVDPARLDALEREAQAAGPQYEVLTWRERTPDHLLEDRALLERRMSTDAPYGDLPLEEEHWDGARIREWEQLHHDRGRLVLSGGAVRDGRLVAFTDLQVPTGDARTAYQGGTLVLREHRGHRLGMRVKLAVLRALPELGLRVERVRTVNSETNAPMVAVNEQLGFVPAGRLVTWALRL